MSPTLVPVVAPPMSASLRASIDEALRAVPGGKRGQATAGVTLKGLQFDVGYKPKSWLTVGGYAAKLWGGGWEAGAKAQAVW